VHKYESALRFTIRTSVGDSFPAPHSRTLPPQRPSTVPIDRPGLISQRRIRPARTPRMLALSPLPAPLIILKTKRAGRIPVSAPRARRRDPVVFTPAMLTPAADRHTSRLYQNPPHPAPRDRRRRSRSRREPEPTATRPHGPPDASTNRDRSAASPNQRSNSRPTPRSARLSPPEIREPPRVESACAALAISVRASAPTFFDFREP
jgi:hypothetical protein